MTGGSPGGMGDGGSSGVAAAGDSMVEVYGAGGSVVGESDAITRGSRTVSATPDDTPQCVTRRDRATDVRAAEGNWATTEGRGDETGSRAQVRRAQRRHRMAGGETASSRGVGHPPGPGGPGVGDQVPATGNQRQFNGQVIGPWATV